VAPDVATAGVAAGGRAVSGGGTTVPAVVDDEPEVPSAAATTDSATASIHPALRGLVPGTRSNDLLRLFLGALALGFSLIIFAQLMTHHGVGIDLEIPLRATQRWVNGGQPYLASSFQAPPGPDLPFLYPPFVLPILAPLLVLPRALVLVGWVVACALGSAWGMRRLGIPWAWTIIVMTWPPFAEGIIGGNVQVLLFAAFIALFYARVPGRGPLAGDALPIHRDPTAPDTPALREGVLATIVAALKVSQLHAWLYLFLRRPRAAVLGVLVLGAMVLLTVPLTGIDVWFDWLAQVRRAADPEWRIGGLALEKLVPQAVALGVTVASLLALWFVPRERAGSWVGVLAVVGALSLHIYGILFMLGAWLLVRREIGLIAATLVAWFTVPGVWAGVLLVAATWALGATRWPGLLEPGRSTDTTEAAAPIEAAAI
jgi:hypothetical protein